jgi:imidazolonepropionase-like amidohydrolase
MSQGRAPGESRRIRCGVLIDGVRGPARGQTVVVSEGRIRSVERSAPDDGGPGVLDWSAYTVLPGLVDAHDHVTLDVGDEEAQSRAPDATIALRGVANAQQSLRAGVTTIRDCGAKAAIDLALRTSFTADIMGPRLLVSGMPLTPPDGPCAFLGGVVASTAEIRASIRRQVEAGVDFIKVFVTGGIFAADGDVLRPLFSQDDLTVVVQEAHRLGRRVSAHCHGGPGAGLAIRAGVDTLEHGLFLTREDLAALAAAGIPLVVTWRVYEDLRQRDDVPAAVREACGRVVTRYRDTIRGAREAGVRVALGTDTVHADLAAEVQALVEAGFSPLEAISAATAHGAAVCDLADVGRIEPGMRADLIAVNGDPLTDPAALRRVAHVMRDGAVFC